MIKPRHLALLAQVGVAALLPASAHHSGAAFDRSKSELVTGTVFRFMWANPHTWVTLDVPNGKGGADRWLIEGPPPTMLIRKGWNGKTLYPGEKVSLVVAPYRDGSHRGEFIVAYDATGKTL